MDFNIGVQQNLVNLNYHYIIIIFDPGILSFFGCMAVNFGDHSKGWAFYLCLTASCYIILQVILSTAPSLMLPIALPLRKTIYIIYRSKYEFDLKVCLFTDIDNSLLLRIMDACKDKQWWREEWTGSDAIRNYQ